MKSKLPCLSYWYALSLFIFAISAAAVLAATPPAEIVIPGEGVFPESLTSTSDGTVIISSVGARTIFRVKPGAARAEAWIQPGADGLQGVYGVLADEKSNTLYACSGVFGPAREDQAPVVAALYTFDLNTGAPKGHYRLPTSGALCNDIAVDPDGAAYATDMGNDQILRLKKGAKDLEIWAGMGGEFTKAGLDGIAVLEHRVVVNAFRTSKLFGIPIEKDGRAGAVAEIHLDREIMNPDGMRRFGKRSLLVAEGGNGRDMARVDLKGRLSRIDLVGNTGKVTPVRDGFSKGGVSVAVVGRTAYVLEGQIGPLFRPDLFQNVKEPLYRVIAVPVGKP